MTQVNLNLGSLAGSTIYLRFHSGDDSSYAYTGWYVDSIQINNAGTQATCETGAPCTPPSPPSLIPAEATCNGINLNYSAGSVQTQSYNIYKINGTCNGTSNKIAGPLTSTNYLDSSAIDGSTYSYLIKGSCSLTGTPESNFSSGANSSSFQLIESGNYTVSYSNSNGCSGTSLQFPVTINSCMPDIVYLSSIELIPIEEDGDLIMEAGEKWKFDVTLKNVGYKDTLEVLATLKGEGLNVCNNPLNFGNIPINGESTKTFEFIIDPELWYSTYNCGSLIGFDLVSKSSNGGAYNYGSDLNFKTKQVGVAPVDQNQNATAPNISNIKNGNKTSNFTPSFSLTPEINSGTVSFSLSGTTDLVNCVEVELLAPDETPLVLKDFGQAFTLPYDITSFYNLKGAGTYKLKGFEQLGCGASNQYVDITSILMDIQKQVGGNCSIGTSACNMAEFLNLKLYKNGTNVNIQYNDLGNVRYNVYVSKTPQTHPFQITGSDYGKKSCDLFSFAIGGNLREISNYNMDTGISETYSVLYLLISADNGFGTESSLGFDSLFLQRSASEYCAK